QQVMFNTTSALFGLFGALCPMLLVILRFTFRRVEFVTNIGHVHMRRWQLQAHLTHRVSNDLRYGKIPEPFVIGWNDVPRRTLCAGQSDGVLIRRYVFWPKLPFGVVAVTNLPVTRRIIQSLLKTCQLLFGTNVQEKF